MHHQIRLSTKENQHARLSYFCCIFEVIAELSIKIPMRAKYSWALNSLETKIIDHGTKIKCQNGMKNKKVERKKEQEVTYRRIKI